MIIFYVVFKFAFFSNSYCNKILDTFLYVKFIYRPKEMSQVLGILFL